MSHRGPPSAVGVLSLSLHCAQASFHAGIHLSPKLATLKMKAPKGDQWLHEIKYDGYGIQVHASPKKVYTRNRKDFAAMAAFFSETEFV